MGEALITRRGGSTPKIGTFYSWVATSIQSDDWIGAKNVLVCVQSSPLNSDGTIVGVRVMGGEVLDTPVLMGEYDSVQNYAGSVSFNKNTGTISIIKNSSSIHFGAESEPTFYNYVVW